MTQVQSLNDLKLLGLKVRDKVTGFTGVCESVCYDLYGCIQAAVRPMANNEKGEMPDGRWFDVSRLEVTDVAPVMEIPGGRFAVQRDQERPTPSQAFGPAEKPRR